MTQKKKQDDATAPTVSEAAQMLGRLGGLKSAGAYLRSGTKAERSRRARAAVNARWERERKLARTDTRVRKERSRRARAAANVRWDRVRAERAEQAWQQRRASPAK